MIDGETTEIAFKVIGDFFVFTQYRLILVDLQGITRSKAEYLSIPYKSIVRFSVETAGTFDLEAELKIWVSGDSAPIQKTLKKGTDVRGVQRAIATEFSWANDLNPDRKTREVVIRVNGCWVPIIVHALSSQAREQVG